MQKTWTAVRHHGTKHLGLWTLAGRTRELLGEFNGEVEMSDGEVHLANISGSGDFQLRGTAKLVMQGDGSEAGDGQSVDLMIRLARGTQVDFVGAMNFSTPMHSEVSSTARKDSLSCSQNAAFRRSKRRFSLR